MATLDVGSASGRKKALNHDVPLIPFIDFLLCLVSFLLITAVWSQMAQLNADTQVPGPPSTVGTPDPERVLHVEMLQQGGYRLFWKKAGQVLSSVDVPAAPAAAAAQEELARRITQEWQNNPARHYAAHDSQVDQAVLHTNNSAEFGAIAQVIDAIYATQRAFRAPDGRLLQKPALNVTFSTH